MHILRVGFTVSFIAIALAFGSSGCEQDAAVTIEVTEHESADAEPVTVAPDQGAVADFIVAKQSEDGKAAIGNLAGVTLTGGTAEEITISSATPPATVEQTVVTAYELKPDGLQFSTPVPLRVDVEALEPDEAARADLRIGVISNGQLVAKQTTYSADGHYLEAQLEHFSTALIYRVTAEAPHPTLVVTAAPKEPTPEPLPPQVVPPVAELDPTTPPDGTAPESEPPVTPALPATPATMALPAGFVPAHLTGKIETHLNLPNQIHNLMRNWFKTGPTNKLNNKPILNGRFFARFCKDALCKEPLGLLPVQLAKEDKYSDKVTKLPLDTVYLGSDHLLPFEVAGAPEGKSFIQFILDSEYSWAAKLGACTTVQDCPGNADVLQSTAPIVMNNNGKGSFNPAPATLPIAVSSGATVALGEIDVGSIYFNLEQLAGTPKPENGKLWVALSNDGSKTGSYRNTIKILNLKDYKGITAATVKLKGQDFAGDICGMIPSHDAIYVIGTGLKGAYVFLFSPTTNKQVHEFAAFIPHPSYNPAKPNAALSAATYPWPCRGVYVEKGGTKYLHLIDFKGAGGLPSAADKLLYSVNVTSLANLTASSSITGTKLELAGDRAWRAIDVNAAKDALYVAEMSWSQGNTAKKNQIYRLPLTSTGALQNAKPTLAQILVADTPYTSDETCGGTGNYPSGLKVVTYKDNEWILMGHDTGIAGYRMEAGKSKLSALDNRDLQTFGQLFMDMVPSLDGKKLYAMPMCKTSDANSEFELPYEAVMENADKNLIAIFDLVGTNAQQGGLQMPQIANTTIDINSDGTPDHGIDQDYYHLKQWIRSVAVSLPIPPVVYTGPQLTVGEYSLFIRGSGRQAGNDLEVSSSGMGQVQDVGVFDLSTGRGFMFKDYNPFFGGLSSNAGKGGGIWGFDFSAADKEASVGAILYVPPQS